MDEEKNEKNIFDMAGSGFESTVRLAKSSPKMWTPIFLQNKNNLVKAINKNVRTGARKANLVLNFIKGKKADVAIRDLEFTRKKVALDIKKTVKSAIANAENNYQYDIDKLVIKEAYCGKQVIMKRFRPRAKGRAAPIIKPYSNLTIILSEQKQNQKEKYGSKG